MPIIWCIAYRNNAFCTAAQFDWCKDRESRFEITNPYAAGKVLKKTCKFISRNVNKRCKFTNAALNCPQTSSNCQCLDNQESFLITSGYFINKAKRCKWVGRKNERCNIPDADDNCPLTCGRCDNSSTLPPTAAPMISSTSPFTTTAELEAQVIAYCDDPDTYDTSKYGYVFCICGYTKLAILIMPLLFPTSFVLHFSTPSSLIVIRPIKDWNVSAITDFVSERMHDDPKSKQYSCIAFHIDNLSYNHSGVCLMAQLALTKIYVIGTYPVAVLLILHPYAPMVLFAVTVLTGPLVFKSKGRYITCMDK